MKLFKSFVIVPPNPPNVISVYYLPSAPCSEQTHRWYYIQSYALEDGCVKLGPPWLRSAARTSQMACGGLLMPTLKVILECAQAYRLLSLLMLTSKPTGRGCCLIRSGLIILKCSSFLFNLCGKNYPLYFLMMSKVRFKSESRCGSIPILTGHQAMV